MPYERHERTMLSGKSILLLSNGSDSTSELGLKLSLHGANVCVIGKNAAMLAQLQHEVHDTGGKLSYYVLDTTGPATAQQASAHFQTAGITFNALVDNTGQTNHSYTCALLDAFARDSSQKQLKHIITSCHTNGDPGHMFIAPDGIRTVTVHTAIHDDALPCAADDIPVAAELYAAIMAREVTYALGDDAYRAAARIIVVDEGEDIVVRLHDRKLTQIATIRRGRTQHVYVAKTGDMGRAVFAGCDFKRGDLIFAINGTRLDHQTEHTIQIDWNCHLEPDSPIRLINHSCNPNVGVKTNADGLPDFYAFRDIQQGEELNFDYAMTEYTHYPRADESLEFSLECRCGSPNCRGKLGYYSELSNATKQTYDGFVSAYFATPQSNNP